MNPRGHKEGVCVCVWRCDDVDVSTRLLFPRPHRWQSKQGHIGPVASAQDPEPHCQPLAPRTAILLSWQDSGSPPLCADGTLEAALRPRGLRGLLLCEHRPLSGCCRRRLSRAYVIAAPSPPHPSAAEPAVPQPLTLVAGLIAPRSLPAARSGCISVPRNC